MKKLSKDRGLKTWFNKSKKTLKKSKTSKGLKKSKGLKNQKTRVQSTLKKI